MISVFPERICCDPERLPGSLDLKIFEQEIRRAGKAAGLNLFVERDQVTVGKGLSALGAKAEPCVAVYHADHKKDYYSYVMYIKTMSNAHYLTTYLGGDSKNYRDTLLDGGGLVFSTIKSRAQTKYAEEKMYYDAVREVIGEALARSIGRQTEPAPSRPRTAPKSEPKTAPKTEPKSAPKAEPKAEPKPKAEPRPEPKAPPKPKPKTAPKPQPAPEPILHGQPTEAEPSQEQKAGQKYSLLAWITWLGMAAICPVFAGGAGAFAAILGILFLAMGQKQYNKGSKGLGSLLLILGSFAACLGLLAYIPIAGVIVAIVALLLEFNSLNK